MKLQFSKDEIEKIKKVVKDYRPKVLDEKENIYDVSPLKKLKTFVYGYELYLRLADLINDENLRAKIYYIIMDCAETYYLGNVLIQKDDSKMIFGKEFYLRQIARLVNSRISLITRFNNSLLDFSKKAFVYDPDEYAGIME